MSRILLLSLFVLLALSLAACGGGEETAESPATAVVDSPATEEAPASGSADAEAPAAAEAQPTEAAEVEPQPTNAPQPTDEPEPTDDPEPTTAPEPESEAPDTAGEGWGESGTTAQSACDHPYFPLRSGTTWTMAGEAGDPITWEVVNVEGDLQTAVAEMIMRSGDLELNYTWDCSGDGGLVSFGFGNQGLSALGPDVTIEVSDGSGMFLPTAAELVPGHTWESNFQSVYTMTQIDGDAEIEINGEMDTQQTSIVLSDEPLTFDGRTVPGLLIQQDSQIDMVMSLMGNDVENSMSMGGEMELGRGLGMLRQTSFTDFGDFTMEVTEVYVP